MPKAPDWVEIRRAYEGTSATIAQILETYGITIGELRRHRESEHWTPRPSAVVRHKMLPAAPPVANDPPPAAEVTTVPPPPAPKPKRATPTPIAQRRALVTRLTNAIDTKLRLLERRFEQEMAGFDAAKGKATSAADFERDTRNIGLLIKNLEQVTDYDDGQLGKRLSGAAAKSASLATTALADEADRLRRELAERLQRLVDPASNSPEPR